ncbi:MAG: hypothetical protein ACTHNS_14435 [Marmoricola sp.]
MTSTAAPLLRRPPTQREVWAEDLLDRLSPAMSALGLIFVLVVLGQQLARAGTAAATTFAVLGWLLWLVFVAEFVARLVVAPDTVRFLQHNWWQVVFLALPFLRILRVVRAARLLRGGKVLSSSLRGTRSANSVLRGRLGWLGSIVVVTILGTSQLLYAFGSYPRYADALHDAALGAFIGQTLSGTGAFPRIAEVLLAAFSVVVFGSFAAILGSFLTEARHDDRHTAARAARPEEPELLSRPPADPPTRRADRGRH